MPWPSATPGGASAPAWGGYVRLWVRAALAPGSPFYLGPHSGDRLDAGNVLGGAEPIPRAVTSGLWVDLSCDVLDVDIAGGATATEGVLTKPDVSTCVVNLSDPDRKYDPLNASGPYGLGGRSRLIPGTPLDAFAEVVDADTGTISRHWLFTGTADSWGEDWTARGRDRVAQVIASGTSKFFVNMKRPATDPPVGAGDTTAQRVDRIVTLSGWAGDVEPGTGVVTHAATALDSDGWDLLNRTLDDELGFVYFTADGALRWIGRDAWLTLGDPVLALGCGAGLHDVLLDASPSSIDLQIRNAIYASRPDAPVQTAINTASVGRYGRYDYERTDLGVATDTQAGEWARLLLQLYAFPQIALADVTFRPALDPQSWQVWSLALGLAFVTDLVRIVWSPPDRPADTPIDTLSRVVGYHHAITRAAWEITWQLIDAESLRAAGTIWTLGPHANDRLDAGFVVA